MAHTRILQIVDSLTIGGTESVAVNLANDISGLPGFEAFLVCTRDEGALVKRIKPSVKYLFLDKKHQLDAKAILKLHRFIGRHKIDIVHAHSTSFFYPVLLKLFHRYKLVWHDHYGMEIKADGKRSYPYIAFSRFMDFAISVNEKLLANNIEHLHVAAGQQTYLPNYSVYIPTNSSGDTVLKGTKEFRIVCLANLRPQKDHATLINAFNLIKKRFPLATLYCIGIALGDAYESDIRQLVAQLDLEKDIFFTGSVENPFVYLENAAVAVLSSKSEGLPLSLIEYGLASLPVVCTNVGQCAELLQNGKNGILVASQNETALADGIMRFFDDKVLGERLSSDFNSFIRNSYSKEAILQRLIDIYRNTKKY